MACSAKRCTDLSRWSDFGLTAMTSLDPEIAEILTQLGLLRPGERPAAEPLAGGVSSDIWKVTLAGGPVCVKRALAKLHVKQEWRAPVERNVDEVAWLRTVRELVPESVPRVLAASSTADLFVMEYLEPADHPVWKSQLRDGIIDPAFAAAVGERLVRIHAATAGRAEIAARFATDAIFYALRLEPYLVATGLRDPDLAPALARLTERTAATRLALVHGDVSPKNILVGPRGPIFLDAECAWYGDPAFDLAFCLNHLLLKCLWRPHWRERYLTCFDALAARYAAGVAWEAGAALEGRAASLLPALLLARVDGKSPVEYVTAEADRDRVRRVAFPLLRRPPARLAEVRDAWRIEVRG
jgi:aminoglycoside phosphotransferase (APT) family kinase protein